MISEPSLFSSYIARLSSANDDEARVSSTTIERSTYMVRLTSEDRRAWDKFAHRCGATYRCAHRAALTWQLKYHFFFRLRRYDIYFCDGIYIEKIGQFAIGVGLRIRVFGDVLQLLPEYTEAWPEVMHDVLKAIGRGCYVYGSDWTTEPSRYEQLKAIPYTRVDERTQINLYVVDFSEYGSWDEYYHQISKNARRNEIAALREGTKVRCYKTSVSLINTLHLVLLKKRMFMRKGLPLNTFKSAFVSMARRYSFGPNIVSSKSEIKGRTVSIFSGIRFGNDLYFMESASVEKPGGGAWCLLIAMLRSAYEKSHGLGKCLLGPDDGCSHGEVAWENLRRQRLQCCGKPVPTSIVKLAYNPPRTESR